MIFFVLFWAFLFYCIFAGFWLVGLVFFSANIMGLCSRLPAGRALGGDGLKQLFVWNGSCGVMLTVRLEANPVLINILGVGE